MSTFKLSEAFKVATDAERNNPLRGVERVICEAAPGPSLASAEAASKAAMIGAQVAPMRGMIEAVSKAALLDAQVAPMRGIAETVSKSMIGAQVAPMRGMIEVVSKAALLDAQVAPIRGMAETLFMAASSPSLGIDSTLKAALSPSFGMMNQALFDGFADMVDKGALGSISGLGTIDVDQIVENFSALVRPRNSDVSLERERIRQLWGCYIYVQVWIICLLVLFGAWKMDDAVAGLLGIGLSMTGWSGKSVASRAREIALDNFDHMYPPGSEMPQITNILI